MEKKSIEVSAMKRQRSVKTLLLSIFCTLLLVTVLCFAVCGGYTLYTSKRDLMRNNQAALDLYLNNLIHAIVDLQKFNEDVYAGNMDFLSMSLENVSPASAQGMQYTMNLQKLIQSRVGEFNGVLLFNTNQTGNYYWFGEDFLGGLVSSETAQIMRDIRSLWSSEQAPATQYWVSYIDGDTTLLMNAFQRRNLYICAMIDIGAYAQRYTDGTQANSVELAFITRDEILTNAGRAEEYGIGIEQMLSAVDEPVINQSRNILQTRFDGTYGIGICGMISLSGVWDHVRIYVVILTASLLIICALFFSMYYLL